MSYNKILQEQISEHLGNGKIPEKYAKLLDCISMSYASFEREQKTLDRSVAWSSAEMLKLNREWWDESLRLKRAQQDIKTLFHNTETVFISLDCKNPKNNLVSDACERVYGYTASDWKKNINLWKDAIHPDDRYMLEGYKESMALGKKMFCEYRVIRKDGKVRWVAVTIIPELDGEGILVRKIGIVNDITERKRAAERLINAEKLLTEAQHLAKIGNWNLDLLTNELIWSDGLRTLLGVNKSAFASIEAYIKLIHPDDRERVIKEIDYVLAGNELKQSTYRIIREDNKQERTFISIIRTTKDNEGKLIRLYGISKDITSRKIAEEKIEQLNMLIYQISHDLRGPLNSAKNYIYLALKRVQDRTGQNYLAKIQDSYAKMEHRVMSLLDLQRMNRTDVPIEKIDLPVLINDILGSIDGLKEFNKVKISTHINIVDEIWSNRQFLHSIFHNLISNAINYRRPLDNSFVNISARCDKEGLIVEISDNGMGIPDTMKSKIFRKFEKGGTSLNGTGLGLYIVKALVSKLNGKISFTSLENAGTTFTMQLPLIAKPR